MRIHLTIALAGVLIIGAATPPATADAVRVHPACVTTSQCVAPPQRGTLGEITQALKGYTYGPRKITHWNKGKIFYFRFKKRHGHNIAVPHLGAKTFPPPPLARQRPHGIECQWEFWNPSCFVWNYSNLWHTLTGGDSFAHTVGSCAENAAKGFKGNLTKAEAGTLLFYSIGADLTEVPLVLKATPGSLALAVLGQCVWGIYRNR